MRSRLNIEQKQKIILHKETHNYLNNIDLKRYVKEKMKLDIILCTISKILKNKIEILNLTSSKKKKNQNLPLIELENDLINFIKDYEDEGGIVNELVIKQKSQEIALRKKIINFKSSDGWLHNFKKRYNFKISKNLSDFCIKFLVSCFFIFDY